MAPLDRARTRRLPPFDIELGIALIVCVINLLLLAVPLVGLTFLPSLFGSVAWAAAALRRTGNPP